MFPISIDTYKVAVAEAAIGAGASIINDVWGTETGRFAGGYRGTAQYAAHPDA